MTLEILAEDKILVRLVPTGARPAAWQGGRVTSRGGMSGDTWDAANSRALLLLLRSLYLLLSTDSFFSSFTEFFKLFRSLILWAVLLRCGTPEGADLI